jgi:hypothetical protein
MSLYVYVMFMLFLFQVSVLKITKGAEAQIIAKNFRQEYAAIRKTWVSVSVKVGKPSSIDKSIRYIGKEYWIIYTADRCIALFIDSVTCSYIFQSTEKSELRPSQNI